MNSDALIAVLNKKKCPFQAPFFINGGVDGARTRDFQRDRLAL